MPISRTKLNPRQLIAPITFSIMLMITGCHSSSGGNESGTQAALSDPEGILSSLNIESLDALKKDVDKKGALSFVAQALVNKPELQPENMVRLLQVNNRNIEYQKLVKKGGSEELIQKLKQLRIPPVAVENLVELPKFQFVDRADISDQALDIFNQQKLNELNKHLALSGSDILTLAEFKNLQELFEGIDMENNFGNLDQQFQNIIVKETSTSQAIGAANIKTSKAKAAVSNALGLPAGYSVINPVDEKQVLTPESNLPFGNSSCYLSSQFSAFPRSISAAGRLIEDDFVSNENGNALMHFPKTGIALIHITDISGASAALRVIKKDGSVLLDQSVENNTYLYLPVLSNESCDTFTFEGASNNYGLTIIDMIATERMSDHAFVEGGEYLSSNEAQVISDSAFFNARSYSFASFDSTLTEFNFLFGLSANSATTTAFDVLIYSPSGKVYSSSNNQGGNGYSELSGLENTTITREAGIWRIDILPASSTLVANQQLTSISAKSGNNASNDQYLSIQTLVTTDPKSKTKEFVLGTMKTLSFTSDGEKSALDEGEISAFLNTSMAPPIEIPSLLDEVLNADTGKLSVDVALWQCWENSEKTGFEVAVDGECYIYRSTYESYQSLFEYENTPISSIDYYNPEVGEYTVDLTEPCPEQWIDQELEAGIGFCKKGIGQPYGTLTNAEAAEDLKARLVLNFLAEKMKQNFYSEEFLYTLSAHYDLYTSWVTRAVQVDTAKFPAHRGLNVKTRDHFYCNLIDGALDQDCPIGFTNFYDAPVILETNRPIFGAPLERVNESTDPITFDYAASDEDEYDEDAALFAVLSFVASQSLNIITGNFAGMVCDTVGLADDLHQLELNAEDDPIGSAKASINRFSSNDPFYGLHNSEELNFFMSGWPEKNTKVDTYGQKIKYAQLACGAANAAISGNAFAFNADFLLSLDYEALGSQEDMVKMIGAMAIAVDSAVMAQDAEAIATLIREGDFDAAQERLKTGTNVNDITQGTDIYSSPSDLLGHYSDQGSAANGNNIIKSNVQYLVKGGDKTRAGMSFERVSSVPVTAINVTFDSVKIISNYESDNNSDDAEVIMVPYVGEVNDADYEKQPYEPHTVFQNSSFHGYGYRYDNVKDGDTLSPAANVYSFEQARNAAALYVELFIAEDDGNSIEDDDMIGVFSQTIRLEEIFNKGQFEWTYLGGNNYQLKIEEYPVYNSDNQRVLENPLSDHYAQQKNHNRQRSPSALVSFTIDVTMSDEFVDFPEIDTGLNPNPVNPGKDTYSMQMSMVNELDITSLNNAEIFDVYQDHIILTNGSTKGLQGIVYSYDSSSAALSELFSYDINDFSGDLLPIKQALTADNNIALLTQARNTDNTQLKALPLFKLLPGQRLLFLISTDDGAKIMIVKYNDQGVMSLESSLAIENDDNSIIYSIGEASLSPDRTGLLVPYVPEDYRGSDRTEPVHTSVLYYTLDLSSDSSVIRYQDFIENPNLTITKVQFIGDNALSILLEEFKFVDSSDGNTWEQLEAYRQDLQNNCTSTNMNCYFALYDRKIQIFSIDKTDPLSQDLDLSDEIHHPYTPYQAGYTTFRSFRTMQQQLFNSNPYDNLETASLTERNAVIRANKDYFELTFDDRVNAFVHSGSFTLSSNNRLRHNAFSHYYCAEGLVCSGYMQDAMKPKRDDENTFISDIRISDFEFADTQRDLVAAIVAGENLGEPLRLTLLSLYDGAAFKGPQIIGSIFDTEVLVTGANDTVRWPFSFTVTDRDTRIDQLQVSVTGLSTQTTLPAQNSATSSPEYTASCTTDANGNGVCTGEILPDFYNANLKQEITVSVSDGIFTSKRTFTIHVDREAPLLENVSRTITLKNAGEYNPISLNIGSINAANNCNVSSYCYLQQNGFVDSWTTTGTPTWLNCSSTDGLYGNTLLNCAGLPPLGAEGIYQIQVTATNTQGSNTKFLSLTVEPPDTTPDMISFTSQGDAELDTLSESNAVTISGVTGFVSISISGGEYWRSSTGLWSSAAATNVVNGESIKLRVTSSSEYSSDQTASLTLAGVARTFTVTTMADPFVPDTTPDAFSFAALTDQLANALVESNSVTITGINQEVSISISSGEYKIGAGDWTSSAGTIKSGDTVQVRHISSSDYSTLVSNTLTIGDVSANFESTTQAIPLPELTAGSGITSPTVGDYFSFTPTNIGGDVSTWSISTKPAWANFNTLTGEISGTVIGSDDFTINITASNASGSDTFTSLVNVYAAQAPYISDTSCNIDDASCDFTFTDSPVWRTAVTQVILTKSHGGPEIATLTSPEDFELVAGALTLHLTASNNLPKSAGQWGNEEFEVKLQATNFDDVQARFMLSEGAVTISNVDIDPPIAAGRISTITLQATNRFDAAIRKFYPTITEDNDNADANALTEVYQYRQASEFGDSNIWNNFDSYNELSADENGDASFDFKTPGCVDLNDGFTLAIGNYDHIYNNGDGDCIDAEWTIREEAFSDLINNITSDDQHHLYRVTTANSQLSLTKYDRNGQILWTKALTSVGTNWLSGIKFVDGSLIITGSSNVDIDGEGEAVASGEFDVFVQRLDLDGNVQWTKLIGTANSDYLNTFSISNNLIYLQAKINTQPNMSGEAVMYRMDLNGSNLQQVLDNSVLTESYGYSHVKVDVDGNYFLVANISSSHKGLKKYNSAGEILAASSDILKNNITDMLLVDDALYVTMDITESDIIEGEIWNTNESKAVRVIRLRTSDLTVVWSHLIQSDASYTNLSNGNGQLAYFNDVLYVSVVASQELYYQGLALDKTPYYSLNLLALNADGAEDGTSGNTSGQGEVLSHQSWLTGAKHATDNRDDPYLKHKEMIISDTGWLYLSFDAKQSFNSTAQMGRSQISPYYYNTNSVLFKTQLLATPFSLQLPQTGLTRDNYFNVINDHDNNLQWIDDLFTYDYRSVWETANNDCASRTLLGTGWRLPTPEEMQRTGHIPVAGSIFEYYQDAANDAYYWSSEEPDFGYHIGIEFGGSLDYFSNTESLYYRCVRDKQ